MNFFNKKENEYIILKEGYNKPLIIVIIVVIVMVLFLLSTKLFMPDTRDNMTLDDTKEMAFNDTVIKLDKGYYRDKNQGIAQLSFKEYCIDVHDEKVKCVVMNEDKQKMPVSLLKGHSVEDKEASTMNTNYILQFGVPDQFYYLTFEIQKGDMSYDFTIDYRDFESKKVIEYEEQYLLKLEDYQSQIKDLESQKQKLNDELSSISKMSKKQQIKRQSRVKIINQLLMKIENDIKVYQHKIEVLKEGIQNED